MSILQQLGEINGTDKHDDNHRFSGKTYLDVYEEYFNTYRESVTCMLEIGVLRGQSLKTWRDYFINAQIWGIDIDPIAKEDYGERINVITGSQIDESALKNVAPDQQFDIIIDDGSHLVDHIIRSYELLWPRVKSGGYYVIEDLGCTYGDNTPLINIWPGQNLNPPDTNFVNDRTKLNAFFIDIVHGIDARKTNVRNISFTYSQCFIKKI